MTFARLVLASTMNIVIPEAALTDLPPRQTAQDLIQYYLANVYSLYPFFLETSLLNIVDDLYRKDERVVRDSDYWLFYMVLAIGSMAQSKGRRDSLHADGVGYVSMALKYAEKALTPGYATQIQSLLLLTIFGLLDPSHFDSWHLIGITARAIIDLGLHQDPPSSAVPDKSALDLRRRIFYSAYALDR